jgi:hypothetical protein
MHGCDRPDSDVSEDLGLAWPHSLHPLAVDAERAELVDDRLRASESK